MSSRCRTLEHAQINKRVISVELRQQEPVRRPKQRRRWGRTDKTKTEKTDADGGDSSEGDAGGKSEAIE